LWPGYYDFNTLYLTCADSGITLPFIEPDTMFPGKMVKADKTRIVSVISIASPRIAQAYD